MATNLVPSSFFPLPSSLLLCILNAQQLKTTEFQELTLQVKPLAQFFGSGTKPLQNQISSQFMTKDYSKV